jgi:hypothetical protein
MLQETDLKLPARPDWPEADEMNRKLSARRPGAGDYPLQQSSAMSSLPDAPLPHAPPVASLRSGDPPDDPSRSQPSLQVPPVASLHNANNPPISPLVPQRRSSRTRNTQSAGESSSRRKSPDTDGSGSSGSGARPEPHGRFKPKPEELDDEVNERGRKYVVSWYHRLNEYDQYWKEMGHGMSHA